MPTNYPTSLDTFTDPTPAQPLSSPSHSSQHANINDAVTAVQTFLGTSAAPNFAKSGSPALTGIPTAPTAGAGNSTTQIATTAFTTSAIAVETTNRVSAQGLLAPKASPALTGTPTAPTAALATNTTQIATTAFVEAAVTAGAGGLTGLTGDVTASGTGSQPATLVATTNVKTLIQENLNLPQFYIGNPTYATAGTPGVGNASHDQTAYNNAAAAAVSAGAGVVLFGVGTYTIGNFAVSGFGVCGTSGLKYAVRGMGMNLTIINSTATSLATSWTVTNPNFASQVTFASPPAWSDFTLDGTGATSTAVGIHWEDISCGRYSNICVRNFAAGASSWALDFENHVGWTEEFMLDNVNISNCTGAVHFSISNSGSGGFPSFNYWHVTSLYVNLNANQSGIVDEAASGSTTNNPGNQVQHEACHWHMTGNAQTGGSNTGALFWWKGNSVWYDTNADIIVETDGGGTTHTSIKGTTGAWSGTGRFRLGGPWQAPTFTSGAFQFQPSGQVVVPGWGNSQAAALTVCNSSIGNVSNAGPISRVSFNAPTPPTLVSGSANTNSQGADIMVVVPVTSTGACTVTLTSAGSTSGQVAAMPLTGTQIPISFPWIAGKTATLTVVNGTIGTAQAWWI